MCTVNDNALEVVGILGMAGHSIRYVTPPINPERRGGWVQAHHPEPHLASPNL